MRQLSSSLHNTTSRRAYSDFLLSVFPIVFIYGCSQFSSFRLSPETVHLINCWPTSPIVYPGSPFSFNWQPGTMILLSYPSPLSHPHLPTASVANWDCIVRLLLSIYQRVATSVDCGKKCSRLWAMVHSSTFHWHQQQDSFGHHPSDLSSRLLPPDALPLRIRITP